MIKPLAAFILIVVCLGCALGAPKQKPNILFIGVDDLRAELGCYGSDVALSPKIDALSEQGLRFNNAYCQQAICGLFRARLVIGVCPSTSGVIHNYVKFRERMLELATLSQQSMANIYDAVFLGKIFHHGDDDDASWNWQPTIDSIAVLNREKVTVFVLVENRLKQQKTRKKMFAKYGEVARLGLASESACECAYVPDNTHIEIYDHDPNEAINIAKGETEIVNQFMV